MPTLMSASLSLPLLHKAAGVGIALSFSGGRRCTDRIWIWVDVRHDIEAVRHVMVYKRCHGDIRAGNLLDTLERMVYYCNKRL
jgi:hypothetical protein